MKPKVLQYGRLMPVLEKQLADTFDMHRLVDEADPKAFLAAHGSEFVGLATGGFNLLVDYVKSLAWGAAILLAIVLLIMIIAAVPSTRWNSPARPCSVPRRRIGRKRPRRERHYWVPSSRSG